jgi:hypothetical protein
LRSQQPSKFNAQRLEALVQHMGVVQPNLKTYFLNTPSS